MVWVVWTIRRKVAVCLSFGAKVLHALPANIDLALDAGHLVKAAPLLEDSGKLWQTVLGWLYTFVSRTYHS